MIYECDHCEEQLHPHALFCHHCGQKFDTPVPQEATPPVGQAGYVPAALRRQSVAARATVVLSRRPSVPPPPPSRVKALLQTLLNGFRSRGL